MDRTARFHLGNSFCRTIRKRGFGQMFSSVAALTCSINILISISASFAQVWTKSGAPTTTWFSMASSADGATLFASSGSATPSFNYISYNAGTNWMPSTLSSLSSRGVGCSGDGRTLLAGAWSSGPIVCVSTNAGGTWTTNTVPFTSFTPHFACSFDGTKIIVAGGDVNQTMDFSPVFISTNSGTTWTTNVAPRADWTAVACSADGTRLVMLGNGYPIFTSADLGVTWQSNATPALRSWSAVACSADGTRIIAGDTVSGWVYRSTDAGMHWMSNSFPSQSLFTLACSSDGTKVLAGCYFGGLYTSVDSGNTWISNNIPPKYWISLSSSADANKLAAEAALGDNIYLQQSVPTPALTAYASDGNIRIGWAFPSMAFALQETTDPTSRTWTNVNALPTLSTTNLQYQVNFPAMQGQSFFRLISH